MFKEFIRLIYCSDFTFSYPRKLSNVVIGTYVTIDVVIFGSHVS